MTLGSPRDFPIHNQVTKKPTARLRPRAITAKAKTAFQALQWRIGMSQVTSRYGYEAPKISKLVYKSNNYGLWYL